MSGEAATGLKPGSLAVWWLACRPATLWAAVAPVLVGVACASSAGGFSSGPAAAALCGAIFIQIGTNFANDLFDFRKGADTSERLGPVRAAQAGLLTVRQLALGTALAFGAATLCGVYLAVIAGWPVIVVGLASIAAGIGYTGGPRPLGYLGLGDVFVFAFFGVIAVTMTAYVQMLAVPRSAWIASLGVGALSTAILVVNNLRDRPTDEVAGKKTLAVRFGEGFARVEYFLLVAGAFLVPPALLSVEGRLAPLLAMLCAPLAVPQLGLMKSGVGRELNPALGGTARLLLIYCVLLSLGLWLS